MEIADIKNKLAEAMGEPRSKFNQTFTARVIETMTALFAEMNGADITAAAMVQSRKLNEQAQRLRRKAEDDKREAECARSDAQRARSNAEKVREETKILTERLKQTEAEISNLETADARDRARLAEMFKRELYMDIMNSCEKQKYIASLGNILSGKMDGGDDDDRRTNPKSPDDISALRT